MAELTDTDIREQVRERYAAAATAVAENTGAGCCGAPAAIAGCGPDISSTDKHGNEVFGVTLYEGEGDAAPKAAVEASLGCGVPTAVADLHEGETVLDLGSGAGADVLISARRVGETGKAIGLDMTDEMLDLARANAVEAGRRERRVRQGVLGGDPAPRRLRRRGDLELRDQPGSRQAQGARRGCQGAASRRALRDLGRDRRPRHGQSHPRGHAAVDRLRRGRAHPRPSSRRCWPTRASRTSTSARPTECTSTPARPSCAPASPVDDRRRCGSSPLPLSEGLAFSMRMLFNSIVN